MKYEIVILGGGPAGLAAAIEAKKNGITNILIIERDKELGGILEQCIHNGFGLHEFNEELTGPEYAQRFINQIHQKKIEYKLNTMVLDIDSSKNIKIINPTDGYMEISAKAIILAMGCRERTRGAISIPGDRPSGILTAGTAQRYVNMEGYMVGKKVIILGSGDIGLIMARRMTLEGAKVEAVVELMPYSGGLTRNIVQCLDDYNIPLMLRHTITNIRGEARLKEVTVSKVDENRVPIPGTEIKFDVDTLLLSVGLIPENDLSRNAGIILDSKTTGPIVNESMETSIEGIFACGNVVHVHDLVDFVSAEARRAGKSAAKYIKNEIVRGENYIDIEVGHGISYCVPQKFRKKNITDNLELFMRVNEIYNDVKLELKSGENKVMSLNKNHMAPGEMEKIIIPKIFMDKININKVKISIEN